MDHGANYVFPKLFSFYLCKYFQYEIVEEGAFSKMVLSCNRHIFYKHLDGDKFNWINSTGVYYIWNFDIFGFLYWA